MADFEGKSPVAVYYFDDLGSAKGLRFDFSPPVTCFKPFAKVFYTTCYADSHAPTWVNNLDGQLNMRDLLRRTLTFAQADGGFWKQICVVVGGIQVF